MTWVSSSKHGGIFQQFFKIVESNSEIGLSFLRGPPKKCIVREHRSSNSDHCWSFPDANPTTQVAGHQNRHFCNDGSLRSLLAVLDDRRRTIERRVLREICYFYSVGNVTAKIFRMRGCGVIPTPTVAIMEESFIFTYFFLGVLMSSLSIDLHLPLDRKGSWSFIGPSLLEVYGMLVWRDLWGAQCLASSHHAFLLVEHQTTSAIAPSFLVLEKMTDVFFCLNFASITAVAKLQWSNVRHVFFIQQVIRHCFFCLDNSFTLDFHLVGTSKWNIA